MKTFLTLYLSVLTLSVLTGQSQEEAAIKKVIENATAAAFANDFETWAGYWAHEPYVYFNFSSKDGNWHYQGWENVSRVMRASMQESEPNQNPVKRDNFTHRIEGNMAWVTFDQEDGMRKWEQRVLEKKNGNWKIINMTAIGHSSWEEKGNIQRVMYFRFKPETKAGQIDEVKQLFTGLPAKVDGMVDAVWMSCGDANATYSHSVMLEFEREEAVTAYEQHPDHVRLTEIGPSVVIAYSGKTFRKE